MTTESRKRAIAKYRKSLKRIQIWLYKCDQDVMDKLESVPNVSAYVKGLIRNDILSNGVDCSEEDVR